MANRKVAMLGAAVGILLLAGVLGGSLFVGLVQGGQLFSFSYPEVLRDANLTVISFSYPEVLRDALLTPPVMRISRP